VVLTSTSPASTPVAIEEASAGPPVALEPEPEPEPEPVVPEPEEPEPGSANLPFPKPVFPLAPFSPEPVLALGGVVLPVEPVGARALLDVLMGVELQASWPTMAPTPPTPRRPMATERTRAVVCRGCVGGVFWSLCSFCMVAPLGALTWRSRSVADSSMS
jgi:radical SAM superfamily enzyme YgiQ (UPF0313 family)